MALALAGAPELPPCERSSQGPARRADVGYSLSSSVLGVCDVRRGRRGRWLVQTYVEGGRYGTCRTGSVRTVSIGTGHRRVEASMQTFDDRVVLPLPVRGGEIEVTPGGVPTWVAGGRRWTARDDGTIGPA